MPQILAIVGGIVCALSIGLAIFNLTSSVSSEPAVFEKTFRRHGAAMFGMFAGGTSLTVGLVWLLVNWLTVTFG